MFNGLGFRVRPYKAWVEDKPQQKRRLLGIQGKAQKALTLNPKLSDLECRGSCSVPGLRNAFFALS